MVIDKKYFDFFNNIFKESKTCGFGADIVNVIFTKKSIDITFAKMINFISLNIDTEEINNIKINNPTLFISVVCSELKNNNAEILIVNDKIKVGDFYFDYSDYEYEPEERVISTMFCLDIKKLESEFCYTQNNYFVKPTATDVVCFGIIEGTPFKLCPGTDIYKIGKLPFIFSNSARIEQKFGHEVKIITLPHYIYNFLSDNASFDFDNELCYIVSNDICIEYTIPEFKTGLFSKRIDQLSSCENCDDFSIFNPIKDLVKKITIDTMMNIIVDDGEITVTIDDSIVAIKNTEYDGGLELNISSAVLNKLFELNDLKFVIANENFIFVSDGEYYFI